MKRLVHTGTKVTVHWATLAEGQDDLGPVVGYDFILSRLDDAAFEELKSLIRSKQSELVQSVEPSTAAANAAVPISFFSTDPPVELVSLNEE